MDFEHRVRAENLLKKIRTGGYVPAIPDPTTRDAIRDVAQVIRLLDERINMLENKMDVVTDGITAAAAPTGRYEGRPK
jgi:hypothetical protein